MKKKHAMVLSIFFWIFTIGIAGLFVLLNNADNLTPQNTSEYIATVKRNDIKNIGEDLIIEIITEEYNIPLYISTNISNKIDISLIEGMANNDTIIFRVENHLYEKIETIGFLNIVSLKTTDNDIFSLDDYNVLMHAANRPARIACGIVTGLFFIFSIISTRRYLSYYRKKK